MGSLTEYNITSAGINGERSADNRTVYFDIRMCLVKICLLDASYYPPSNLPNPLAITSGKGVFFSP